MGPGAHETYTQLPMLFDDECMPILGRRGDEPCIAVRVALFGSFAFDEDALLELQALEEAALQASQGAALPPAARSTPRPTRASWSTAASTTTRRSRWRPSRGPTPATCTPTHSSRGTRALRRSCARGSWTETDHARARGRPPADRRGRLVAAISAVLAQRQGRGEACGCMRFMVRTEPFMQDQAIPLVPCVQGEIRQHASRIQFTDIYTHARSVTASWLIGDI